MKVNLKQIIKTTCIVGLATIVLLTPSTSPLAQSFTYTNADLVAGFRIAGGANDLIVDLGQVSKFESMPARSVTVINNLSTTQFSGALPAIDGVSWGVYAALRGSIASYPQYPLQTIWITSPRPSIYIPGPVWHQASQGLLGGVASQIDAIGVNAATYGSSIPAGMDNSFSGIVIPSSSYYSYTEQVGNYGQLNNTFPGNPENTTPDDFDSAGLPSRSVLYRLEPDAYPHANGTVIGFFDFNTNGVLSFTAGPPPEPTTIIRIVHSGAVVTLTFPTVNLVGYRLHYTNSVGLLAPISVWPTGATLIGNGSALSLLDTNTSGTRFYAIEAYY
jgi:hypothetical protein